MDEQAPMITRTQIKVITPPTITPGKRIEPGNAGGVAHNSYSNRSWSEEIW